MINDPIKLSFREGFLAGLEAAADYHEQLAYTWINCSFDATSQDDKDMCGQQAEGHRSWARKIHDLKEKE